MKSKNGKTVMVKITKGLGLNREVQKLLAYPLTPGMVATWLETGSKFNPNDLKGESLERLLKAHRNGGTVKRDGLRITLNPFRNAVEVAQKNEAKEELLVWFPMKHGRHEVKDKDGDDTTRGTWTMTVWADR
jgi:hypothetical protein